MVYTCVMHKKDKFFTDADRRKPSPDNGFSEREGIKKTFLSHLPVLPDEMVNDIFGYFYSAYGENPAEKLRMQEKLGALVCLFSMDFTEEDDCLSLDEWKTISQITDDFALELDDTLLMYIMSRAVEKGCFRD